MYTFQLKNSACYSIYCTIFHSFLFIELICSVGHTAVSHYTSFKLTPVLEQAATRAYETTHAIQSYLKKPSALCTCSAYLLLFQSSCIYCFSLSLNKATKSFATNIHLRDMTGFILWTNRSLYISILSINRKKAVIRITFFFLLLLEKSQF